MAIITSKYSNQFLNLTDGQYTMLQETLIRVQQHNNPIIVCNVDHRFMVAEQCNSVGVNPSAILLEPVGRNTTPTIALEVFEATKQDPDAIIAVFPVDHVIKNQHSFDESLNVAIEAAKTNKLETFGIVADKPEAVYGYIKSVDSDNAYHFVENFVEKNDLVTAELYVVSGNYFWNTGMFVFKASVYLAALERNNSETVSNAKEALAKASADLDFIRVNKSSFEKCIDDSIDYAAMETADNVVVVPMDAGWND